MNQILGELGKSEKFIQVIKNIQKEKSPIEISGLSDIGMLQILSSINTYSKKPMLLITYNEIEAKRIFENMKNFSDNIVLLPKKEIVTYDYIAESKDLPFERIEALNQIVKEKNIIVITTIESLMQKLPSKEVLYKNQIEFKKGETYNLEKIKHNLIDLGYKRFELIDGRGQFSVRGGILDISLTTELGVRIEFWGDDIDSIRTFNIINQRSIKNIDKVTINPTHEYVLENEISDVVKKLEKRRNLESENSEIIEKDIEYIRNGDFVSKIDKYFDIFYKTENTVLDYLNSEYLIVLEEESKIKAREKNILKDNENLIKLLTEKEKMVPDAIQNLDRYQSIQDKLFDKKVIYLEKYDNKNERSIEKFNFKYFDISYYKSEVEQLFDDLRKWLKEKKSIYMLVDTKEKLKKIEKMLIEQNILVKIEEKLDNTIIVKSKERYITIAIGKIEKGFECNDINQIVISANDLIEGKQKSNKKFNSQFKEAEKVVFADLKIGDYVVHSSYGIGIYIGVNTIKADGVIKDYIKIKYDNDSILYIPTNQMEMVRKYVAGDKLVPKLNKLGTKDWENTKTKVKKNLREVAKELIELYAKREKVQGHAFNLDTPWQQEFEAKFPYQETEDQLRCIEEVKKDMEIQKPMDRLLCGDVGYGKTEVALRAAFKAVMDGKQVAYLAPTTVLAQQQYKEFKERTKDYPIKVEVLNRFKTKKYQDEVIEKLKLGEIDIVVGTHRILSKDVGFKDLGLLIIDEEHRFGVKAKEKIKQYKTNVDVLTMTATPIPRTLHMSIVGVRDMSVIYEPPYNRKPVQTYVLEYDKEVITEAITKEVERNGQVFYLFNNVEGIEGKALEISNMVKGINVGYAHGQMTGKQIEEIMQEFVDKKINVLVCTTILESGIDIPNANTIIVENADKMGLAQLYQIRGRVGRSDKQAYAYITYKRDKILSEIADKRLKAIKEFTEFGSGFKIAMRDLEIRGAGSLIGEIQSGHLEQVGYDTYCYLLDEVVKEVKGEDINSLEEIAVQIDLNVSSFIPETYISDHNQKIEVYQNIALCKNEENIINVVDEIIDRFGDMPKEVENLINIARIKYLAKQKKIEKITSKRNIENKNLVVFTIIKECDIIKLLDKYKNKIKLSSGIKPNITLELKSNVHNQEETLKEVIKFIQDVK